MWRLPHRSIAHQRRPPRRDASTNTSGQSSPAHSRIRPDSGPDSSPIISRARVDSACVARTGVAHRAVVPSAASPGTSGAAAAARLMAATVAAGRGRLAQPFAQVGRLVEGLEHRVPALAARVGEVQADGPGVESERPSLGVMQHPADPPPAISVHVVAGLGPGFLVEIGAIAVV